MPREPTKCKGKRGLAYGFKDENEMEALSAGMAWW